jgi:hypothetical protein
VLSSPSAPLPERAPFGPGAETTASGGVGLFFFSVVALMALIVLIVPRLSCHLRGVQELGTPLPFLLLLERPG